MKCRECSTGFTPIKRLRNWQKYCSPRCARNSGQRRRDAERKMGIFRKVKKGRKSAEANKRHIARSLKYQEIKLYGREKKEFMLDYCVVCLAKDRRFVAHHINGEGWGKNPDNSLDNLTTLCIPCHMKLHNGVLGLDTPIEIMLRKGLGQGV